ncbi:MAG: 23S rRNA (guanosine(2251)-2'-O)-methyltransferase RlmB [Cytophagales bacterium]|nr:MAG: 23S rRNA (guanosine(2251)-2'-O)-methyltransferase RlmB [Cytophagales bacterium]
MNDSKDFIFGIHTIEEAILAGKNIDKVLIQKEMSNHAQLKILYELLRQRFIPFQEVPIFKLDKITRKNHQGVIAFLAPVSFHSLSEIIQGVFEKGENPFILILDRITDVRNFGAIIRSAEGAGVHAVVVPFKETAQIGNDAMKTSSGALSYVPICREFNLTNTVQYLQNSGLQVIACSEKTEKDIYDLDFTVPTAIIVGSEETGIAPDLLRKANAIGRIPMFGHVGSLNVSVSAAVAMYELVRQRKTI